MAQLPTPGGDPGNWGTMLNAFLEVAHNTNGTLKSSAIVAAGAGTFSKPASGIPATDFTSSVQAELTLASTSLQLGGDIGGTTTSPSVSKLQGTTLDRSSPSNGQVLAYNATSNSWIPSTVSSTTINDATSSTPGLIQLDGDLGNTATTPEVVSTHLSSPLPLAQGGTGASTQNFVDLSSNQTIAGTKTFNSAIAGNITGNAATVTTNANLTGDVTSVGNATTVAKIKGVSTPSVAPATGQVLTATSNSASAWSTLSSAPVSSVFGRTGVVTATSGDYTATQVGALPSTDDLSAITTANPTTNSWSNNSKKITNIANGSTATDAAAYGQIPTAGTGSTNYTAGNATVSGDLTGALPNPTVAKLNGITAPASAPSGAGQVLTSTSSSASAWSTPTTNASSIDNVSVSGTPSSGQVMTATGSSAANWQTPASAPVNSVFGRTGVVVASSGDYTASQVTNALSSTTVTTKGDLLAATGSSTITRLGVGTDGQVLTAASGQSTGIQWATAASAPVTSVAGRTGAIVLAEADITNLTTDIAARVQLGGDLGNSTTTPKVESIQGVGITGTPSNGQVLTATGSSAATWSTPSGGSGNATSIDGVTVTGTPSSGQAIIASSGSAATWTALPSAPVSSIFGRTGVVAAQSGDYTASQVGALPSTDDLGAIASANPTAANWSNNNKAITNVSDLSVSGITGATAASRYVGATTSGAPASGTFALGDFVIDQTAKIWVCTTAGAIGSGGVFTQVTGGGGSSPVSSVFGRTGAVTATTGDYTASQVTGALVSSNNLSDVSNESTAFSNIKQSATSGSTGVIQLAGDLGNTATSPEVVSTHLSSPLPIGQGGTGSATQNFVDLSTNQTIGGTKTFSSTITGNISGSAATATTASTVTTIPALSGDVTSSGSSNVTTVAKLNGITAPASAPSGAGQVLTSTSSSASAWSTPASAPVNSVFGRTGVVVASSGDYTVSQVTGAAPLSGPTFTGTPLAPTATTGTNTTQLATTAFVGTAVSNGSAANATSSTPGLVQLDGDLGNSATSPEVVSTHLSSPLPIGQGGTGSATQNFVSLAGDLGNSVATPRVESIQGVSISGTPSANQVLTASNSSTATWASPASAPVSSVFGRTGVVVSSSGDYTASQVTNAADKSSGSTQTFTANLSAPALSASGITGATAASRYVGATTSGAPASGTFALGDFVIDQTAKIWVCTTAGAIGSGGVFTQVTGGGGSSPVSSVFGRTGAVTATTGDYTASQVTGAAALDSNTRLAPADRDNVSAIFSADQTPSTLTNGTTYRYNCSSSSISQTLPTTPTVGTTLSFKRTDSVAANTLSLVAGGSDTFGESSPTAIGGAQSITYVYGSDSAWHATSSLLPIANLLTTSIASTLYTPLGIPAFQGNYQYVAGQLAVYEDELYLATNTFTSTSTFNSSNWYLVGSSSNITLDTTASDIQPIGNLLAGSTGDAADAGHVHPASSWLPADSGLKAWSFDPANISNLTTATTGGAVVFAKVRIALAQTVSYVWFNIATAAVNANSSGTECGVAIYDATGGSTQYGASGTGTAATAFGTSGGGLVSVAISTPVVLQPAIYTVAWWCNVTGGGSQPIFSRGASSTGINGSQTGSSARFGNAQTSVTSTPSLLSSMAAGQTAWWVALS